MYRINGIMYRTIYRSNKLLINGILIIDKINNNTFSIRLSLINMHSIILNIQLIIYN